MYNKSDIACIKLMSCAASGWVCQTWSQTGFFILSLSSKNRFWHLMKQLGASYSCNRGVGTGSASRCCLLHSEMHHTFLRCITILPQAHLPYSLPLIHWGVGRAPKCDILQLEGLNKATQGAQFPHKWCTKERSPHKFLFCYSVRPLPVI